MKPFVSVIVPCRNEAPFLERCLDSILASDYPPALMEVIVADGMSVDGTRDLLHRHAAREPRLRLIDNAERVTPAGLNRAIAVARGEIIVRFDGHAVMPPDYLPRCVELLESSRADNAGGSIRTIPQTGGLFAGPIAAALSTRFGVGDSAFRTSSTNGVRNSLEKPGPRPADTVFGGCFRRELFSRIGGFNEHLERGQDLEFNQRLRRSGGTIVLDPAIVCDYYARSGLATFWRHNFSNGAWAVLPFAWSDGVPVRARHLIPLVFVAALAGSLVLPFPWSIVVPAAYAGLSLAASAWIALERRQVTYLALMPVVFLSLHLAYGLGSVWGLLQLVLFENSRRLSETSRRLTAGTERDPCKPH
jgi:glycosyltransferase involved in cell wall biosynthesis